MGIRYAARDLVNASCAVKGFAMNNASGKSLCSGRPLRRMLCAGEQIEKV